MIRYLYALFILQFLAIPDLVAIEVSNFQQLRDALNNRTDSTIYVTGPITMRGTLRISRSVAIRSSNAAIRRQVRPHPDFVELNGGNGPLFEIDANNVRLIHLDISGLISSAGNRQTRDIEILNFSEGFDIRRCTLRYTGIRAEQGKGAPDLSVRFCRFVDASYQGTSTIKLSSGTDTSSNPHLTLNTMNNFLRIEN